MRGPGLGPVTPNWGPSCPLQLDVWTRSTKKNNATPICFVMPERERKKERERERKRNWTYECGLKNRGFWRVCL